MQLWSVTITLLLFILVNLSRVATQGIFPAGNFESLRRGNCSKCTERLHQDVAQLPRLTLIKQRILQALGRNPGKEPQHVHIAPTLSPKAFIAPKQTKTTPEPVQRVTKGRQTSEVNEIITFPEAIGTDNGETIINFKHRSQQQTEEIEAVGASLLLYIDRRRKIKKGGRGKKILLTVTEYEQKSGYEDILTYLRTRVKRRRWKKISLPLSVARKFLDSGDHGLSLKVNCIGCGRLVQLAFSNNSHAHRSRDRKQRHGRKRSKASKRKNRKSTRRKENTATRPILVISTRPKFRS